ncbi:hypothetical protein FRC03_000881 [Tulasnella sp. 419]|nr:hypothetical protein FRC03_000881 [Tulasnella sp. 419]
MIIEKSRNAPVSTDDTLEDDAPPTYDAALHAPAASDSRSQNMDHLQSISSRIAQTTPSSSTSQIMQLNLHDSKAIPIDYSSQNASPIMTAASKSNVYDSVWTPRSPGSPASWLAKLLGTPQARTDQQVRHTVLGLLQDLVKQGNAPSSISILQSCAEACRSRGLSFESIVQEPGIQGHTPLYWAIIKSSFDSESSNHSAPSVTASDPALPPDLSLIDALCSMPLKPETYADALQACMLTSSHHIFTYLKRHSPFFQESILTGDPTGSDIQSDLVEVSNGDESMDAEESAMNGAFRVRIKMVEFQKRMRVLGSVRIEFVARGRIWALTSLVYSPQLKYPVNLGREVYPGSWILLLDLIEHSPATWIDSRLTIVPPQQSASEPATSASPFSFAKAAQMTQGKSKLAPIVFRMRSPGSNQLSGEMRDKTKSWDNSRGPIMASLSDHPQGSSLQFDGCPYIHEDSSLHIIFEARLVKPGNDCVFM